MLPEWDFHYAEWMIGDGQPNREAGEVFESFDLEFYSERGLTISGSTVQSAVSIAEYRHRVTAQVVFVSDELCVIDFGLRVVGTADQLPQGSRQGDYVTGDLSIDIPLSIRLPNMSLPGDLARTMHCKWRIEKILADMTPWISRPDDPKHLVRDEARVRYEEVESTDSVKVCSYILHCARVD